MSTPAAQLAAVRRLVDQSVAAVDALAPGLMRHVMPALVAARDELRSELTDWLQRNGGADKFGGLQKRQLLLSLESTFDRIRELEPAMGAALSAAGAESGPLAVANLQNEIARLSAIFDGGMPAIPQLDQAAIIARGEQMLWRRFETSARRYTGSVGEDIRHQMAVGLAKGENISQLVTRIAKLGDPLARASGDPAADASGVADAMFGRARFNADRLVRTELMHAYNVQHDLSIEEANADLPPGEPHYMRRWDSSADRRVCALCDALDGKVAEVGGMFPGGVSSPPRHPGCRCVSVPWLERWGADWPSDVTPT